MKKFFTPFVLMLLSFVLCSTQADAQKFYNRSSDPVTEIVAGTDYVLQNPWTGEYHMLSGTTAIGAATETTVYNFEEAGQDADGNKLYRLKQKETGEYLEDPDLSNGQVSMTKAVARAFVFTALQGVAVDSAEDLDGDGKEETTTQEWKDADVRTKYEPMGQTFENVFVFCNKNLESQYLIFEIFHNGYNCMWTQYTNARIWHIYTVEKASAYDDLCNAIPFLFPNGVEGLYVPGNNPGQVPEKLVQELDSAYNDATLLMNEQGKDDNVYYEAIERMKKAQEACKNGINPVKEGFYVIDNSPLAGRAHEHGTTNACMKDTLGQLHWAGFSKPEKMTVEGAAYIWEVIPAEGENGGWYLRNYGTGRYAGSLNKNYQAVPSSETASQVYDINFRKGEYFSLDMRGQNQEFPSLHADNNPGLKIVIWEPNGDASQWRFLPVDKSELEGIEGELAQNELNKKTLALVNEAQASYNKGFVYSAEGCTRDANFVVGDGLITKAAGLDENGNIAEGGQLISNAPELPANEPGNCYANLLDGNFNTYFHSSWQNAAYANVFHNLDISLDEAVQDFNIKYAQRHNNWTGSPTKIHVYASNDTTGGQWTDQGYMTCEYTWNATLEDGTEKSKFVGIASHQMDAAYKYVRFAVEKTLGNGRATGGLFYYWSELRMYKSQYDASLSLIEAVPAEVKQELLKQIDLAKAEIEAGAVKKETYDALEAAYKEFIKNYPDPQIVKDLLAEAKGQADGAVEGDALGYFAAGAKDALNAVIDEVSANVKDVMTVAEVNDAKAKIEQALSDFNAKLNVPEGNQYFYLRCATTSDVEGSASGKYLHATNNDESQVKYFLPDDMGNQLNYVWKSIKHEDGSYTFMNCATGTYLGNPKANDVRVNMSLEADSLTLRSAKVEGLFNFVCAENVFYNAQPGTGNLVTWSSASGTDNSAFAIEPFDDANSYWDGESVNYPISGKAEIITLPIELIGTADNGIMYYAMGIKDGLLQLGEYTDADVLSPGTPFIFIPNEGVTTNNFYTSGKALEEMNDYAKEGLLVNGLKGVLQEQDSIVGGGILFEGNIISAVEGDKAKANSGYFAEMPTTTTEEGATTMKFPESIETAIEEILVNNAPIKGIYSLTGVKVRNTSNTKNLPKGIYIVNGNKMIVK